jgi:signal transduction histidine kinase
MKISLRDMLLRKDLTISSESLSKRAMLTGFLSVTFMIISTFYLLYNRIYKIDDAYFVYYVLMAAGIVSYLANRNGRHFFAKIMVLGIGTLVVFLFSAKANFQTDTHFYYIAITLCAFVLFGYEQVHVAIIFLVLSIVLFYGSFTTGFSILPDSRYPEDYIRSNQVINFVIALVTGGVFLYYMVRLNFMSEEALKKKQVEITTQNQELLKTNAELDSFVYSASHDLRAPLASVMGLINIAKRSNDPCEMHQYLDMMASRVNRLDEFIHEIIDFSKNSRTEVYEENIEIQKMVVEILDSLKHTDGGQSINFHIDIPENLCLRSDTIRLSVILNNLIGNAIKFSDTSKKNSFIRIEVSKANDGYAISVDDNGIGIEREHQPKVFDMFFRGSERSKGSGLGLYIVKESVHKIAGSIYLKSKPGVGSTFTVLLPERLN